MRFARSLWFAFGLIALGLGMLGIALPLLPTTPFVLLAAFAFARSSPRLHRWLLEHRLFGPLIRDWQRDGAISREAKISALLSMLGIFALSVFLGARSDVLWLQALVLLSAAAFILSRPRPR